MKWKKNLKWTWESDMRYWFLERPLSIIRAFEGIAQKDHILNDMDWREYLDLHLAIADMKCGRLFRWEP